jgi:hypothetical protein
MVSALNATARSPEGAKRIPGCPSISIDAGALPFALSPVPGVMYRHNSPNRFMAMESLALAGFVSTNAGIRRLQRERVSTNKSPNNLSTNTRYAAT